MHDHWNKTHFVHCAECGRNRLHYAHGLCQPCYKRWYWREIRKHDEKRLEAGKRYAAAHREEARERARQWRVNNPEKHRVRAKQWRKDNPKRYFQYNEAHRERQAERARQWAKAHPARARENCRRRRARKRNATIKPVDEQAIFERDGHTCMYCGAIYVPLTIDHIVALNNGGSHCEDNLMLACGRCNPSKGTKPLEEWLQTQPYSIAWLF